MVYDDSIYNNSRFYTCIKEVVKAKMVQFKGGLLAL